VQVLNGVGTSGLAGQVASALSSAGFLPPTTGNASSQVTSTVIRYAPANRDAAVTLAAAVPGSVLAADSTLGPAVELVVGTTYRGVQPVRVGQRLTLTQAAPSATASAPRVRPSPQPSINGGTSSCV
jgi:hypothetical protein